MRSTHYCYEIALSVTSYHPTYTRAVLFARIGVYHGIFNVNMLPEVGKFIAGITTGYTPA